jgi:nitrous oxidase accessory protein NosD
MPRRDVSPRRRLAGWSAAAVIVLAACGGDDSPSTNPTSMPSTADSTSEAPVTTAPAGPPRTITVPGDQPTIQQAVDAARTGDLVLVSPGSYAERVVITTPGVTLRGLDRNGVVLDGGGTLGNGIMVVGAGSVVENLTVTGYTFNGVLVTGDETATGDEADDGESGDYAAGAMIEGYRVSYVTAYNNGLYGIYAFGVRGGQIDHSYASGHPDSGFYVGQCKPCDVLLTDNVAEHNRIGYEGTNAGGNTFIVNSIWRNNRIGITINSEDRELLAPQETAVVAGNLVTGNANPDTPDTANAGDGIVGLGIGIGGGTNNIVTRNRITDNGAVGVAVTDLDGYSPIANQITDNVIEGHTNDLALYSSGAPVAVHQNCFSGNRPAATWPADLETLLPCGTAGSPPADGPGPPRDAAPAGLDYLAMPAPPPQADMPDAGNAAWGPHTPTVPTFDVTTATVPAG